MNLRARPSGSSTSHPRATIFALGLSAALGAGCSGDGLAETDNNKVPTVDGGDNVDYPKGDIGFKVGQQVINMSFLWHKNGLADKGSPLAKISMADFYAERKQGAKLLYLSGAAEWCGPCQIEARLINAINSGKVYQCTQSKSCTCAPVTADEEKANKCDFCADLTKKPADCQTFAEVLKGKGWDNALRIVQVVLQDQGRNRSDQATLERWEVAHNTEFSVGIDPKQLVSMYIPENAVPQSLFINLANMTLQKQEVGTPILGTDLFAKLIGELTKATK